MTKRTASPLKIVARDDKHDPIFRAIAAHRRAAKIFNEVVVEYGNCSIDRHLEATEAPRNAMFAAGDALVTTKPTTMRGAVALLRYLSTLMDDIGTGCECSVMPDTIDTSDDEVEAWQILAFRTVASALAQMQSAETAVEAK
jgi:hypothetical protein